MFSALLALVSLLLLLLLVLVWEIVLGLIYIFEELKELRSDRGGKGEERNSGGGNPFKRRRAG